MTLQEKINKFWDLYEKDDPFITADLVELAVDIIPALQSMIIDLKE